MNTNSSHSNIAESRTSSSEEPKTLTQIAEQLKDANTKVQLIYAFNGTGKTRLLREFEQLIAPKNDDADKQNIAFKNILLHTYFLMV